MGAGEVSHMKQPIFPAVSAAFCCYGAHLSARVSICPWFADLKSQDALLHAVVASLIDTIGLVCLAGVILSGAIMMYRIVHSIDIHSKEEPTP